MINAADLAHHSAENEWDDQIEVSCCTFGAPAAGNRAFVNYFDATVKESTRVTVEDDPIIYLPPFPWFSVRFVYRKFPRKVHHGSSNPDSTVS